MMKINPLILLSLCKVFVLGSQRLVFLSTGRWISQSQLDFEQIIIFDDVVVSKCDGVTRQRQFKPILQETALPERCDEAYNNILEAIYNIQDHTNNTVDDLQRRRGCNRAADGTESAFEAWALNGNDFITFNPETLTWTSESYTSLRIKEIWDEQLTRSNAFSAFLKNFCSKMITKMALKPIPKTTELRVFAKPVENSDIAQLVCHVTTTDPSVKTVGLIGNGATQVSGFSVRGPLPSGDGSQIIRLRAWISLSHPHLTYGCAVQSENHNFTVYWDGKTLDGRHMYNSSTYKFLNAIIGFLAVIGFILVISCAMITLLNLVRMRRRPPAPPPRPELQEQFERFIQSATLYPAMRDILLSVLYGPNTPDSHRGSYNQWLEMKERENYYDPEFYGRSERAKTQQTNQCNDS